MRCMYTRGAAAAAVVAGAITLLRLRKPYSRFLSVLNAGTSVESCFTSFSNAAAATTAAGAAAATAAPWRMWRRR